MYLFVDAADVAVLKRSENFIKYAMTLGFATFIRNNSPTTCCVSEQKKKKKHVWIIHVPHYDMSQRMTESTKWHVRPAKTQISLGIRPIWLEYLLSQWRKSLATHWAHSGDSDQTGRMPSLIWVFAVRTCHFVCFVMRGSYYYLRV